MGGGWAGLLLYVAAFLLLFHLVDRLATRVPPGADRG